MNIKRYMNELIVLLALLLLVGAYVYKHYQGTQQTEQVTKTKKTLNELKEVVALKKIWGDKKISKKVIALEKTIPASKVKWSRKQNKVTASYKDLTPNELNQLITKVLNTPVSIVLLDVTKQASNYNVEFKCKW